MKQKIIDFLDDYIVWVVAAIVAICAMVALNSCKDKPAYIPPSQVTVIENQFNPSIDTLKKGYALLMDSVLKLNKELEKQKQKTTIAESNATATAKKLKEALNKKDTGSIIVYADDIIEEFNNYVQNTNTQDSIQEQIIEKQAATIETNRAEIELHESKFNQLKTAYQVKEIEANDWKEAANNLDKKLKKKKFWNGVWKIGTAAGVGLAAIIFL